MSKTGAPPAAQDMPRFLREASSQRIRTAIESGEVLSWPPLPDGRILLADSTRNLVAVRVGVVDSTARMVYGRGQCLALAVSLTKMLGCDGLVLSGSWNREPGSFSHVVTELPDGQWLDIEGVAEPDTRPYEGGGSITRMSPTELALFAAQVDGTRMPPQDYPVAAEFARALASSLGFSPTLVA